MLVLTVLGGCAGESFPAKSRRSFVRITRETTFNICNKETQECDPEISELMWGYQGSAFIIDRNSIGAFVGTANHVCVDMTDEQEKILEFMTERILEDPERDYLKPNYKTRVKNLEGQVVLADVIAQDEELDACVLFAEGLPGKPLKRFYGALVPGTRYYNVAAPLDTYAPGYVPMFSGYYVGEKNKFEAGFSIPAIGGSSGSPVVDVHGRLVGILHSVLGGFDQISYATNITLMNRFIDDSIEDYHDAWYRNLLKLTRPKN